MIDKEKIASEFRDIQKNICLELEKLDGSEKFKTDIWERKGGGGGITRNFENGTIIEKGGVNYSKVYGKTPPKILKKLKLQKADFFATGVSIVLHPQSPMIPIIHMNVRYFEMSNGVFWFGGGIDLTPHYIDENLASQFHFHLKKICDQHHPSYYDTFKKWADEYFYIKHRKETRGIGGIFFDRLTENENHKKEDIWNFVCDVAKNFVPIYSQQVHALKNKPFGQNEKHWQYVRRGRYVEFNLIYDKGTRFGLDTDGRTESILISMPPTAQWIYFHKPAKKSVEMKTLERLKKGINWISC